MVRDQRGFTLIEFIIAAAITAAVLGSTVMLASQMQQVYTTQLDDTTVEEEVRFALDWISQALRNAGSNPYSISDLSTSCPGAGSFTAIDITDSNGNGLRDEIHIHADINPPNGLLGGTTAGCDEETEDLTIAHDADDMVITRQDNSVDATPVDMTEPIVTALRFTYLDSSRAVTTNPNLIEYVQVQVTAQSQAFNIFFGEEQPTSTLETEIHLRTGP